MFARSPWPLLVRVHRPPFWSSPFVLKNVQVPCSVSNEYCKAMHVQTLPEEFFTCANLQPDRKHGVCTPGECGLHGWGTGDAHSSNAMGAHSPDISLTAQFPSYTPKKGRGTASNLWKGQEKKKTFPQNLITHNSCIQVCVSSKST